MSPLSKAGKRAVPSSPAARRSKIRSGHDGLIVIDAVLSQLLAKAQELEESVNTPPSRISEVEWGLFITSPPAFAAFKTFQAMPKPTNILQSTLQEIDADGTSSQDEESSPSPKQDTDLDNCQKRAKSLHDKLARLNVIKSQPHSEIEVFASLRDYGTRIGLACSRNTKTETRAGDMANRAPARANAPAAQRTVNPQHLTWRDAHTGQPELAGDRNNSGTHPADPVPGQHTGRPKAAAPQDATNLIFPTHNTAAHGAHSDNTESSWMANLGTPFPSSDELALYAGLGPNNWDGIYDSSLPSVNLWPGGGGVVEQVSRLLCLATVPELFQIQQLVQSQLDIISAFVCANQPQPPTWDSGGLESATVLTGQAGPSDEAAGSGGGIPDLWQMSDLDPWQGSASSDLA